MLRPPSEERAPSPQPPAGHPIIQQPTTKPKAKRSESEIRIRKGPLPRATALSAREKEKTQNARREGRLLSKRINKTILYILYFASIRARACAFVRAYLGLGPFRWNLPQSFLLFRPYQAGTHNTKSDHRTTREAPVTPTILTGLVTDGCRPAYQGAVRRTTVAWGGCAACVARASRRPARGPPRRPPGAPSAASALGASA